MTIKPLPDKLSALIRVAVADLQAVMKDDRYKVDMKKWHTGLAARDGLPCGKCHVCLAGSVIAKSFEAPIDRLFDPSDFGSEVEAKLKALNMVRSGAIRDALYYMTDSLVVADETKLPPALENANPPRNLKYMPVWLTGIAAKLEAIGL